MMQNDNDNADDDGRLMITTLANYFHAVTISARVCLLFLSFTAPLEQALSFLSSAAAVTVAVAYKENAAATTKQRQQKQ